MNIYLVERPDNAGYDEYDSFVCVADSEDEARHILPAEHMEWDEINDYTSLAWVSFKDIDKLKVTNLGIAEKDFLKRVVLTSFNAG